MDLGYYKTAVGTNLHYLFALPAGYYDNIIKFSQHTTKFNVAMVM